MNVKIINLLNEGEIYFKTCTHHFDMFKSNHRNMLNLVTFIELSSIICYEPHQRIDVYDGLFLHDFPIERTALFLQLY